MTYLHFCFVFLFLLVSPNQMLLGQPQELRAPAVIHAEEHIVPWGSLSNREAILSDQRIPEIISYLKDKYGADTVILFGSRARGKATEKSDYDLIVFIKNGEKREINEVYQKAHLQIFLQPHSYDEEALLSYPSGICEEATILIQKQQSGEEFLRRLEEAYQSNSKTDSSDSKDSDDIALTRQNSVNLLITNLKRSSSGDIRENYYRHKYLMIALNKYFTIRKLPSDKGASKSLEWIQENDPLTYVAFEKAYRPDASIHNLHHLLIRVAGPYLEEKYRNPEAFIVREDPKEEYDFRRDPRITEIKNLMLSHYPQAQAIILYGSRAQGMAKAKSDYDILIFDSPESDRRSESIPFHDTFLDVHYFPHDAKGIDMIVALFVVEGYHILYEKNHIGRHRMQKTRAFYNAGFHLSDKTKQIVVDDIKMQLSKIDESVKGQYYRYQFLTNILVDYFTMRNQYYIGSRQAFRWIKTHDYPTYLAMEEAMKPNSNVKSFQKMVDLVIAPFKNRTKT